MEIQWFTTAPSGKAHTHSADDGQTGWKLHAVAAEDHLTLDDIKNVRALCGLLPRHGWGLDLFIEDKCSRCMNQMGRFIAQSIPARSGG